MDILLIIIIVVLAIIGFKVFSLLFSAIGKILIILLLVLVAYAVFVHADRDLAFEGYVFPDQSITVDENPFIIKFEPDQRPSSIQVDYYQKYFFINKGHCKTIVNVDICFANTIYDLEFNKFKANISAYKVEPDLTIRRTINDSRLVVGESARIFINVTNGVGIPASDFRFTDSFSPEEFEIEDVDGDCIGENNSITYAGTLRENEKISCEYELRALKELTRSSRARASYFNGVEDEVLFSNPINFEVDPAFSIKTSFNESDRKVYEGEKVLFIVNISNKHPDEEMENVVLDIYLPSGLAFERTSSFEVYFNRTSNRTIRSQRIERVSEGVYQFTGNLLEGTSKFIVMELKTTNTGRSDILLDASYEIGTEKKEVNEKESLEVEHKEIVLFANFEDGAIFDSGEEKLIKIGVSNPSDHILLKNINIRVDTSIADNLSGSVLALDKLKAATLINKRVKMPSVDSNRNYQFDVIASYDTEYGVHHEETFEYDFKIEATRGLSVNHDISRTSVEAGETFTVKTRITNNRNTDIKNIRVFDVVPQEFQRKGLNSISNLNVLAKDTVTAYEYRMAAPEVETPKVYSFRTTARFEEENKTYAFERQFQITVNPRKVDLSIANAVSDPTTYEGAVLDILYTLQNPDDEKTLRDITLSFPVQQDVDLIGHRNFSINRLLPGESYTLRKIHKIRLKNNGSIRLNPALIAYEDENGNTFKKNSSSLSLNAKEGYITGPAFFITKESNSSATRGEMVTVRITVENIGTEKGKITIADSGKAWNLNVGPEEKNAITYKIRAETAGRLNLKPASGKYEYRNKPAYTVSNSAFTDVKEKVVTELEEEEEEEEIQNVTVEKVEEPEEKGFFQVVWNAISNIFKVFSGR